MPRRPATITQADISRAIRAAKKAGAYEIEVPIDDATRYVLRFDGPPVKPQSAPPRPGPWWDTHGLLHGHIYFIEGGEFIKIGFSASKETRIRSLQGASPFELKLLVAIEGTLADERVLHKRFAQYRVRGEWFRATPELLEYITALGSRDC